MWNIDIDNMMCAMFGFGNFGLEKIFGETKVLEM
jgi:hypothetical protein